METLDLTINGERVEVQIEPGTRLQQLLHDTLGMTGTKEGCGAGLCGCCTVMVDDMAVKSCLILALQVRGRSVKTIEGLAQEEVLDPVQEAFIEKRIPYFLNRQHYRKLLFDQHIRSFAYGLFNNR